VIVDRRSAANFWVFLSVLCCDVFANVWPLAESEWWPCCMPGLHVWFCWNCNFIGTSKASIYYWAVVQLLIMCFSLLNPLADNHRHWDDESNYDMLVNFFCTLFLCVCGIKCAAGGRPTGGAFYAADKCVQTNARQMCRQKRQKVCRKS